MSNHRQPPESELQAKLDLYRAGADDPEFASICNELAQSSEGRRLLQNDQRFDRAICAAMHEVPVPQGFTARIIAGVEARAFAGYENVPQDESDVPKSATLSKAVGRLSRRKWLASGLAATVAVAASLAFVLWPRHHVLDEADLQESQAWHVALADQAWHSMARSDLSEHHLPRQLLFVPNRYLDASEAVGRNAIAYDLSSASGTKATLFVIEQEEPIEIQYAPPQSPQHRTWGYSVAYWQDSSHIYVVVVESGHPSDYRRLIDSSTDAGII